jgi:hypothetical protein
MCLRFKFCTNQRVCVLNFLRKVKFVVPYCTVYSTCTVCLRVVCALKAVCSGTHMDHPDFSAAILHPKI